MKWGPFKRGIDILDKYTDDDEWAINAEHDQFWAGPDSETVSEEDAAKLKELGWRIDEESWSCFT
jgi:hypothetical protein